MQTTTTQIMHTISYFRKKQTIMEGFFCFGMVMILKMSKNDL